MRPVIASVLVWTLITSMSPAAQAGLLRRGTPEQREARQAVKSANRKAKTQAREARKLENQGPTMRLMPRAPEAFAPRTPKDATDADVATGEEIKERFRGREGLAQSVLMGRVQLRDDRRRGLSRTLATIEDQLEEHPVFPVDKRTRIDRRVLRRSPDVQRDAKLLLRRLATIPGVVPAGFEEDVTKLTAREIEGMLGEQDVYTRESLDGVRDLLHDRVYAERVASRTAGRLGEAGLEPGVVEGLMPLTQALAEGSDVVQLQRLDLARPKSLPLELQVAAAKDPAVARALGRLQASGKATRFQRLTGTPAGVLESINVIAVTSQENYLKTWLPALVEKGAKKGRPNLRPTKTGLVRSRSAGLIEHDEDPTARLETATDLIDESVGSYLRLITEDGLDDDPDVALVNKALEGPRRQLAGRRMLFDNAHERTHGAQELIKKMMYIGPLAHSLEMANLGVYAKLVTGSGDDLLAEAVEWKALRGSGFTNRELFKRTKVLIPVGIAATVAAGASHHILEHGNAAIGGLTFGASAVALSLTTALQSIRMYRHGYAELLRQGKVKGKVGVAMTKEFQANLKKLDKMEAQLGSLFQARNKPRLLAMVKAQLDVDVASGGMGQAEADGIIGELESMDMESMADAMEMPSSAAQWKAAFGQDFSNPARLGVMLGAAMAPLVGMATGAKGLLDNGFILAGVGSTESIVAGATVYGARVLSEAKYAGGQAAELARAQGKSGFVEVSLGMAQSKLEARQRKVVE